MGSSVAMTTTGKIAKGAYVSEWVDLGAGRWVHKYNILGATMVDYSAWEPTSLASHAHSTITFEHGLCLGAVGTRDIPAEVDALPGGSKERIAGCRAWWARNEEAARAMVLAAFPQDFR